MQYGSKQWQSEVKRIEKQEPGYIAKHFKLVPDLVHEHKLKQINKQGPTKATIRQLDNERIARALLQTFGAPIMTEQEYLDSSYTKDPKSQRTYLTLIKQRAKKALEE